MASTHKRRLSDFLKPFAKSSTFDFDSVETEYFETLFNVSASGDVPIFCANGPGEIRRVRITPDAALAHGAASYTFKVFDRGTAGAGVTQLGSTFDGTVSDLTKWVPTTLYSAAVGVNDVPDGEVLTLNITKNSTPAAINILVQVEFVPLMDT